MQSSDYISLWGCLINIISKLAVLNFITLDEGENEFEMTISSLYRVDMTGNLVYFSKGHQISSSNEVYLLFFHLLNSEPPVWIGL